MRGLGSNDVLTLHHATRECPRPNVLQPDIVTERAKQRNAVSQKHRDAGDNDPLDQACVQESLDGYPSIHVEMGEATCAQPLHDLQWASGHELTDTAPAGAANAPGVELRVTTGLVP